MRVKVNEQHIDEVWELVKNNFSHRGISKIVGISRASVQSILKGAITKEKLEEKRKKKTVNRKKNYVTVYSGRIERCKSCGALVHMPCHECKIKEIKNAKSNISSPVL